MGSSGAKFPQFFISGSELRMACRWLATLLVAWGLLETKTGHRGRAKAAGSRRSMGKPWGKPKNGKNQG